MGGAVRMDVPSGAQIWPRRDAAYYFTQSSLVTKLASHVA